MHTTIAAMKRGASGSEVTCGIPPTLQSNKLPTIDVSAYIKQEIVEDHCARDPQCFSATSKNLDVLLTKVEHNVAQPSCATLNGELQLKLNEEEPRDDTSTKLSATIVKSVKNEDEPHVNKLWSGGVMLLTEVKQEDECNVEVENHELYSFKPGFGEQEACDECCKDREDGASDVPSTFIDIRKVKADHDTHFVGQAGREHGSQAETFGCNDSATENDRLRRPVITYDNATVQKPKSKTEQLRNLSVNTQEQQHFIVNPYKCTGCNFTTKFRSSLSRHVTARHSFEASGYQCTECNYRAKGEHDLSKHIADLHGMEAQPHQCKLDTSKDLKRQHNAHAEIYKCSHCDYATKNKHSFYEHSTLQHDPDAREYRCADCSYTSKSRRYLGLHISRVHRPYVPVYRCSKCGYSTKEKHNLSKHVDLRHNEHPEMYKCSSCEYATRNKYNLAQHVRLQHNPDAKEYKCADCDYTSKCRKYLSKHVSRNHRSDAPVYRCGFCSYTSKLKHGLSRHVYLRHNEHVEMYKCSCCDFVTKYKNNLIKHFRFKHDPDVSECEYTL